MTTVYQMATAQCIQTVSLSGHVRAYHGACIVLTTCLAKF